MIDGADSLGKFKFRILGQDLIYLKKHRKGEGCGVCEAHAPILITYTCSPRVSTYAAKANSLLIRNKRTKNFIRTIGVSCGCYAKVHRQIAHIEGGRKK